MAAKNSKTEIAAAPLFGKMKGSLTMGLVGLPNVGKSSTFVLLTKLQVPVGNRPFCTIDPHEARVSVPDDRFDELVSIYTPKSAVPASLTVFDIAGLVPGAHEGLGLGNAFLSHISAVDGIYHVVRAFEDLDVTHTEGEVNPVADLQTISDELRYKDIERVERILVDLRKIVKQQRLRQPELDCMEEVYRMLVEDKQWVSLKTTWTVKEVDIINQYNLLTTKPVVYLVNVSEMNYVKQKNPFLKKIHEWITVNHPGSIIPYSASFEENIVGKTAEEVKEYVSKLGGDPDKIHSAIPKIILAGYHSLDLIHYFTAGEKEVKCWTIRKGTKAPQAAGLIHTDMENGFICADTMKYSDLLSTKSEAAVRAAGKLYQKGKEYIVEDGDVMLFKFNPKGSKK